MDGLRTITRRSKPANKPGAERLVTYRLQRATLCIYKHVDLHMWQAFGMGRGNEGRKRRRDESAHAHSSHASVNNEGAGQMVLCSSSTSRREAREKTHTPVQQE